MAAKVYPLRDYSSSIGSSTNRSKETGRRFNRPSEDSLNLEHNDGTESNFFINVNVPSDQEMAEIPLSLRLLYYFQWLCNHSEADIDKAYLGKLANETGSTSSVDDDTGFSVIHYAAAQWSVMICKYLVSKGAQLHHPDKEGRTSLHIAAYFNHTDMMEYLLDNGADPNCRTDTMQTPIHFAVRGDSIEAIQLLIERGAWYSKSRGIVDARGRTPLQLAVELDRNDALLFLLTIDKKPAQCSVVDNCGHPALSTIILRMPKLGSLALDQFRKVHAVNRYQEYRLGHLETDVHLTISPFEAMVETTEYRVLTHPVMRKLIEKKWNQFALFFFTVYFSIYVLFVLVWTILYAYPAVQVKHRYNFPTDIWRIMLWIVAILLLVFQILLEIMEYYFSYHRNKRYKEWLQEKLMNDIKSCSSSPFFKPEKFFLEKCLRETKHLRAKYFKDLWNFIDIITLFIVLVTSLLHTFDVLFHTHALALWVARIGAISIILVWIRMLYYARASAFLGPMVVIIGQISANVAQYFLIVSSVFIPYAVAFWVLFGGEQQTNANITNISVDLLYPHRVAVMLFRMMVVDDYPYDVMRSIDELTTTILVISFIFFGAVVSLNLFIALLSDTFQRVYDNAKANAEMQKAQLILSLQDKASKCTRLKFFRYIKDHCSPLREHYDEDDSDEDDHLPLTKITHQIHNLVKEFTEEDKSYKNEIEEIKTTVTSIEEQVSSIHESVSTIMKALSEQSKTKERIVQSMQRHPNVIDDRQHSGTEQVMPIVVHPRTRSLQQLQPVTTTTTTSVGYNRPGTLESLIPEATGRSYTPLGPAHYHHGDAAPIADPLNWKKALLKQQSTKKYSFRRKTHSSQVSNPNAYQGHRKVQNTVSHEASDDDSD